MLSFSFDGSQLNRKSFFRKQNKNKQTKPILNEPMMWRIQKFWPNSLNHLYFILLHFFFFFGTNHHSVIGYDSEKSERLEDVPAYYRAVGLEDLWRSLLPQSILWFYVSMSPWINVSLVLTLLWISFSQHLQCYLFLILNYGIHF